MEEIGITRSLEEMRAVYKGAAKFSNDQTQTFENVYHVKLTKDDGELKMQECEVADLEYWDLEMIKKKVAEIESAGIDNVEIKITPNSVMSFKLLLEKNCNK